MLAPSLTDISEDLDNMEDSIVPPYLTKPKAYSVEKQRRAMEALLSHSGRRRGSMPNVPRPASSLLELRRSGTSISDLRAAETSRVDRVNIPLRKWQVQEVDYNAWQLNPIDSRNIYSSQEASLLSDAELPLPTLQINQDNQKVNRDSHQTLEHLYINQALIGSHFARENNERRRFAQQILQEYKQPIRSKSPSYGAPDPEIHTSPSNKNRKKKVSFFDVVKQRMQAEESVKTFPENQSISQCGRPNPISCQFCDVLGPNSCHRCIETTNRKIARDIEISHFPDVDCTATTLVAPKLAKVMRAGEELMMRTNELGENYLTTKDTEKIPPITITIGRSLSDKLGYSTKRFGRVGVEKTWDDKARLHTNGTMALPPLRTSAKVIGGRRMKPERPKHTSHLWQKVKALAIDS